MPGEASPERIKRHFERFAETVAGLPLYHRLAEAVVHDAEVRDLLRSAQPGQARPVLLLAAVHDLLLRRPDLPAARWYPSITPAAELASGDPYPAFRAACLDHAAELREVIATHRTQTNEVNRCVLLAPLLAAAVSDVPEQPVALVELGCSAGLLLGLDRYRIAVGDTVVGDPESPVHLAGAVVGPGVPPTAPLPPTPPIIHRVGLDLAPVALSDVERVRWLEACLWPDQPRRVERFRAAVALGRLDPPHTVRGDLIDGLADAVAALSDQAHVVVFHAWALTYVDRGRRPDLAVAVAGLAAAGRPVSWLSLEPPGSTPGIVAPDLPEGFEATQPETVLGLRRWRERRELAPVAAGWAHPHGDWLSWSIPPVLRP